MMKYLCLAIILITDSLMGQTASLSDKVRGEWQQDFLRIFEQQDYKVLRERIYNPEAVDFQKLEKSLKQNLDRGLESVSIEDVRLNEYENLKGTIEDIWSDSGIKKRKLRRFPMRVIGSLFVLPSDSLPDPGGVFVFYLGVVDEQPIIVFRESLDPDEETLSSLKTWTLSDNSTFEARLVRVLKSESVIVFLKNNYDIFEVPDKKLSIDDRKIVDALTKRGSTK